MNGYGPDSDDGAWRAFREWLAEDVRDIPYIVPWGRTRIGSLVDLLGFNTDAFNAAISQAKADYEAMKRSFTRERPAPNPGSKRHRRALRRASKRRAA